MRKLAVFNNITLDGYFSAANGDIGWAHGGGPDPEFDAFVAENASGGGQLLLGRKTYDLMAGYWPTDMAKRNAPAVAEHMNRLPKVVFSRTLDRAAWSNTEVVKGDIAAAVRGMKEQPGPDMAILGSGSIVTQLAQAGLIDEFQMVVNPVVLGGGRTMFDGLGSPMVLRLAGSRTFTHGKVFLRYESSATLMPPAASTP
ncbi:MAG TPA: dihydrofolate reductase family protein [Gemmatimonadales bacterium]|nr:dihydrofolate reductase family protein [Gemmatimonadales bacterium]